MLLLYGCIASSAASRPIAGLRQQSLPARDPAPEASSTGGYDTNRLLPAGGAVAPFAGGYKTDRSLPAEDPTPQH